MRVDGLSKISATLWPASACDASRSALSSSARSSRRAQLVARKLLAGEEVARHLGIVDGHALSRNLLTVEPLPRPRPSRRRDRARARSPSTACCATSSRPCSRASHGTSRFLQEAPPHWLRPLATAAGARRLVRAHVAQLRRARAPAARRVEPGPDRLGRGRLEPDPRLAPAGGSREARRLTLTLLPGAPAAALGAARAPRARRAERGEPARDAHGDRAAAARDVERAAARPCAWSADDPLVFGGDLNLRMAELPERSSGCTRALGLAAPRPGRGDRPPARARPRRCVERRRRGWRRPSARRTPSDHAPVVARFGMK